MSTHLISRRRVLAGAAGIAGAAVLATSDPGRATAAPSAGYVWNGSTTANGWPVVATATRYRVEGTDCSVLLAPAAAPLLLHCLRRYHYEIDGSIRTEEIEGHTTSHRVDVAYESNRLSGSAIAIRPAYYPLDASGGLFDHEVVIIRDILADCGGLVRWGRDEARPKESHFQIDVPRDDPLLRSTSAALARRAHRPGQGAGAFVDPFSGARRRRALALSTRQSR